MNRMKMNPTTKVWTCFLYTCRLPNNLDLGELVEEKILELNHQNYGPYVLLSNIYVVVFRWNSNEKVWKMMQYRCVKNILGFGW